MWPRVRRDPEKGPEGRPRKSGKEAREFLRCLGPQGVACVRHMWASVAGMLRLGRMADRQTHTQPSDWVQEFEFHFLYPKQGREVCVRVSESSTQTPQVSFWGISLGGQVHRQDCVLPRNRTEVMCVISMLGF